MDLRKEKGS